MHTPPEREQADQPGLGGAGEGRPEKGVVSGAHAAHDQADQAGKDQPFQYAGRFRRQSGEAALPIFHKRAPFLRGCREA